MALNATSKLSKCLKIQARSVSWDTNPSGVIFSDRDIASATGEHFGGHSPTNPSALAS